MFPIEYASWIDLVLDHYVFSVIISVFLVATTFIISKMNKHSDNCLNICSSDPNSTNECDNSDATAISSLARSPAIIAEKVIEANMTEEQKRLEQEVKKKQLAQIYELMQQQSDKFGNISMTEVEEQMKLYQ